MRVEQITLVERNKSLNKVVKLAEKLHKELFEEASGTAVHSLSLS